MKKIFLLLSCLFLLVSCISTKIEYFSEIEPNSNKVFIQLDQNTYAVNEGTVGYTTSSGLAFFGSDSETIKLGTIKNKELIKKALQEKGYEVVNSVDEADIIMVGESTSNSDYSKVSLGFYDKQSNQLLFICEGTFGIGFGIQSDLNNAVKKALESIPKVNSI